MNYPAVDIAVDAFTPKQFITAARNILALSYKVQPDTGPSSPLHKSPNGNIPICQ